MILPNELWRYISLFLDKPYYIYYLNKNFHSLKYTYIWLLPQYFKSYLIGNDEHSDTQELKEMSKWYCGEKPTETAYNIITDLVYILDSVYTTSYQRSNQLIMKRYKTKTKINIKTLKQIIRYNITGFNLNNDVNKFNNCKVDIVYRLPGILMRYIKQEELLQIRALIY